MLPLILPHFDLYPISKKWVGNGVRCGVSAWCPLGIGEQPIVQVRCLNWISLRNVKITHLDVARCDDIFKDGHFVVALPTQKLKSIYFVDLSIEELSLDGMIELLNQCQNLSKIEVNENVPACCDDLIFSTHSCLWKKLWICIWLRFSTISCSYHCCQMKVCFILQISAKI